MARECLKYGISNESIRPIIEGMGSFYNKNILAIGGSGDAAFALVGEGASVSVVDYNQAQIDLIKKRKEKISRGEFDGFMEIVLGEQENRELPEYLVELIEERRIFFDNGRLKRIFKNIRNLNVLGRSINIFEYNTPSKYQGIYLSNILSWDVKTVRDMIKRMNHCGAMLEKEGLLYLSDFADLLSILYSHMRDNFGRVENDKALENRFSGILKERTPFVVDFVRTKRAQGCNSKFSFWKPAVFRKI